MIGKRGQATSSNEREVMIAAIVDEVIRKLEKREEVDYEEIERTHSQLMPDLGDRLRRIRQIGLVVSQAAAQKGESGGADKTSLKIDGIDALRETLTEYEFLEQLDHGGQGKIFKVYQRATNRIVAIKVLLDGPLASPRQRSRFTREIELLGRLNHPSIVTVYESGVVGGVQYFAMEFVDGLPIDDYALLEQLDVTRRIELFRDVCRAVAAAHQRGVLHRDLKPANILVDDERIPHILDFGLAKDLASDEDADLAKKVSLTGQVVGTLEYLSPEHILGRVHHFDVRSDVYSLGVILYELITGALPYPSHDKRHGLLEKIATYEAPRMKATLQRVGDNGVLTGADVTEDLEWIVEKALEKEPGRRYQSASAFADDLDRILTGDAVDAGTARGFYILRKTLRSFRVHVIVALVFLGILVASLGGMIVLWQRAERVARIAQTGMEMGSFVRHGTIQRDLGRWDEAIGMMQKAIELAEFVPAADPHIERQLFSAHYVLAQLFIRNDNLRAATEHCEAIEAMADSLLHLHPDDVDVLRRIAYSYVLRGQIDVSSQAWTAAVANFRKARASLDELRTRNPDVRRITFDLAFALGWEGWAEQQLKLYEESFRRYERARQLFQELVNEDPSIVRYEIELSHTEGRLAVWHLHQRRDADNDAASALLKAARTRLNKIKVEHRAGTYEGDIASIFDAISKNEQLVEKRRSRRSRQNKGLENDRR